MSDRFESNLVGRRVTPIPPGEVHIRDDLPQGIIYQIHTVYLEEGEPMAMAEKVDVVDVEQHHELLADAPKDAKMFVANLGQLWELLP